MPPAKKKSSTKKGGGSKRITSAASSASHVPRSNQDIIGNTWKTGVIKKQVLRELNEALLYESTSANRTSILAKIDAIDGVSVEKTGCTSPALIPRTYETQPMLNMKCLLTVGKTAPFYISKRFHGRPVNMIAGAQYNEELLTGAKRWTGKDPVLHVMLPNLCIGNDCTIFLGECYLDKEDTLHFAHCFARGASSLDWPDSFAVHQCPFCCQMALPVQDKNSVVDGSATHVMIVQNIMQCTQVGRGLQAIHRGLPRLCCKMCFGKNLLSDQEGGEYKYPTILEHGIVYTAGKDLMSKGLAKIERDEGTSIKGYIPSAFSLYDLYRKSGMVAAIDEAIYLKQKSEIELIAPMMGLSVGRDISVSQIINNRG